MGVELTNSRMRDRVFHNKIVSDVILRHKCSRNSGCNKTNQAFSTAPNLGIYFD